MKRIVVVGMLHFNRIEHAHLVTGSAEHFAAFHQDFALRIGHYIAGVQLQNIRQCVKSCFTCAGTANDKDIVIQTMQMGIQG